MALVACGVVGCSGGPRFPPRITFEGARLEKATSWSRAQVWGVVFVPRGETLPGASLQVALLASREHASGAALSKWVMEQYRASPTQQWYESAPGDEACKIGLPASGPPRPFLALHVCRMTAGLAACAEVDERLDDGVVARCLSRGWACWDEMCAARWSSRRTSLEALLGDALPPS